MGLTIAQAAERLGVAPSTVTQMIADGHLTKSRYVHAGLDPDQVDRLALGRWQRHPHGYWCNITEAASILGVTRTRVRQLVEGNRVPAVRHDGHWYFRRAQLEVVANARLSRRLQGIAGSADRQPVDLPVG